VRSIARRQGGDRNASRHCAGSWCFRHLRRSPRLHSVRHEIHGTERQGGRATGCLPDLWRHNSGRLPRLEIDRCEPASDRQGRPAARPTRQRSRTVRSLPRYIGIAFHRKTTTKSWWVPFPALNLSSSGPPQMFSLWSRTQKGTPRRGAGGLVTLRTENPATKHCTKPASPATNLSKLATSFSLTTHLGPDLKYAA
jgi:hypothetical protein